MLERKISIKEFHAIAKGYFPTMDFVDQFHVSGIAMVKKNGRYGVIDENYEIILKPENDFVEILKNGVILVHNDNRYTLHHKLGGKITQEEFWDRDAAIVYAYVC